MPYNPPTTKILTTSRDPYRTYAAQLYGITYEQVTSEQRQCAKRITFRALYTASLLTLKKIERAEDYDLECERAIEDDKALANVYAAVGKDYRDV